MVHWEIVIGVATTILLTTDNFVMHFLFVLVNWPICFDVEAVMVLSLVLYTLCHLNFFSSFLCFMDAAYCCVHHLNEEVLYLNFAAS